MLDFSWITAAIFLFAGVVIGLLAFDTWIKWHDRGRQRIPNQWALEARGLVTNDELAVWHWLQRAFYDHKITVKTPISRFTRPRNKEQGQQWFDLLSGVYCTFSVSTPEGAVVGCLDVPGKAGLLRSHRDMKESILTTCGIAYAVVRSSNLPSLEAMRAAFLGEIESTVEETDRAPVVEVSEEFALELASFREQRKVEETPPPLMNEAHASLKTKLEFARRKREAGFNPLITHTGVINDIANPGFKAQWEDSFMAPLESRPAKL